MSWKISGLVWELDLTHSQQSVLLAVADHAKHDGSDVFPSVARIAWKTGYSDRQVRRTMKDLRELGILILTKESNRYRPREYKIDIAAGKKKDPFRGDIMSGLVDEEEVPPTGRADMGVIPEAPGLTPCQVRGDTGVRSGVTPVSARGDIAMSPRTIIKDQLKTNESVEPSLSQDDWVKALIAIKRTYYRGRHRVFDQFWNTTGYAGRHDGKFRVTCLGPDQRQWLEERGKKIAENVLVGILGVRIEIEFVVTEEE